MALHLKKTLIPLPNDALCYVSFDFVQWFWRRIFSNVDNIFLLLKYYLFLENGMALHLNKFEISLPKNILWQVWLKLVQWFQKRFLNVHVFWSFHCYIPSDRGVSYLNLLHLRELCVVSSLVEIDPACMVLEKKMTMWKVNRQTDRPVDGRRTTCDQKS